MADAHYGAVAVLRAERGLACAAMGPLPEHVGIWCRCGSELRAAVRPLAVGEIASSVLELAPGDLVFLGVLDAVRMQALRLRHDAFGIAARCAQVSSPFALVRVV